MFYSNKAIGCFLCQCLFIDIHLCQQRYNIVLGNVFRSHILMRLCLFFPHSALNLKLILNFLFAFSII